MLSGNGTMCFQLAATLSANDPWAYPNTLSPGLKGHPFGIGESEEIFPAYSDPRTNGKGGWFWYFLFAVETSVKHQT